MNTPARILGVVLAGGRSSRFGSDKALAELEGRALLDHALDGLRPQCQALAVGGRAWPGVPRIADRPGPGLGPLGGVCGALRYAVDQGFDLVVTVGCDTPRLPADLVAGLAAVAPAIEAESPLIGCWPASLSGQLDAWLAATADRSLRGWAQRVGARAVQASHPIPNINRPGDLDALIHAES